MEFRLLHHGIHYMANMQVNQGDRSSPHTFRRTVTTIIDRAADAATAAGQLGHDGGEVTRRYYIAKRTEGPDVRGVLEGAVS